MMVTLGGVKAMSVVVITGVVMASSSGSGDYSREADDGFVTVVVTTTTNLPIGDATLDPWTTASV